ncbi:multidrug ABC transporter ATP-binding protein [Flavipsychrobacter stenotrophus]|uniref:Multidrug ABC transporter ATP-binding protein n=1 Tax=Flavipsychrobacter stenotrophus TaxID=2077091 RepID=A0A2S7T103_9BACT|nr:ABC transporter transmembrane domain-containing protein [Flavipsychrobacter stenotrophus]PQJ12882.1 multidrug ABC transporter ATP-binding protein [Flavipsychrobacter stenotrophus]
MARRREIPAEESPKVKFSKEAFKESLIIFKYLKPYRGTFIVGLIFIALSSGTTMAFPYLLKKLIDSAHGIGTGPLAFSPGGIALVMISVLSLQMIFSFMRIYLFTYVGENAVADMRKEIYQRLIIMPIDFFGQRRVGELSSRITADVSQIEDAVTSVLAEILRGILTLIIGIGCILYISPQMTLLMLSVIPFIIVIALVFSKRIRKLSKDAQDQLADSGTVVQETLQGISNVKAFSNEWYEIKRYDNSISNMVKLAIRNGKMRGFFVSFLMFSVFGAIVLVVWYGAGLMQRGVLSFGDLTQFVICTAFVGGTMAGFAELYSQLQKTLGATQRVRELLKEQVENVSVEQHHIENRFKLKGNVSIDHIAFSYPSRSNMEVLKDISIEAWAGEQIAIVGPSGAGKSTIVSLLLRFYDADKGHISFDGIDATDFPLSQLRSQMALVPQDILLFGGTIYENIAYGKPDATRDEVMAAAKQANAFDFISSFPEGFETVVGERGIKLSGGQRQRVAIARAILKDPVILLLDEATSALDSESEAQVQEALTNLMRNRTSFVIAHRLSTIRNADKIIVMEDGRVKEAGTHAELVEIEDGLYRSLNRLQMFKEA